jgi:hypothetical protein
LSERFRMYIYYHKCLLLLLMAGTLIVHHWPMPPLLIVIRRERSQPSIIYFLASQYRSHSVPLAIAAHCPRWFLSMGSRSMQKVSGRIPMLWRCVHRYISCDISYKYFIVTFNQDPSCGSRVVPGGWTVVRTYRWTW